METTGGRFRSVGVGLAVFVASTGWFAGAGHLPVADPRDADGRLDIRRADVLGNERPRWKVATHRGWRARDIWDRGFIVVRLDTLGDDRFDFYALVRSTGRALRADLYRDRRRRRDVRVARVDVWRKNRRTVSVRIPWSRLAVGGSRVHYTWAVQTLFTGPNCRRTCFDVVPNSGAVLEPLIRAPGSPTPTPTETVSPSPAPTAPSPTPTTSDGLVSRRR